MQAEPIHKAYESICDRLGKRAKLIYLSPQGKVFNQNDAKELAKLDEIVFLCGHYEGVFGNDDLGHLLDLLAQVKGMFMLTMFPHDLIASYAEQHNWTIHRIERFISASKTSRRKQEEWMVCNYEAPNKEQLLF